MQSLEVQTSFLANILNKCNKYSNSFTCRKTEHSIQEEYQGVNNILIIFDKINLCKAI